MSIALFAKGNYLGGGYENEEKKLKLALQEREEDRPEEPSP